MSQEKKPLSGKIIQTSKDGKPILWTFVPEMPSEGVRSALPWLTVVSWEYDGSSNNGMPAADVNSAMMEFEIALTGLKRPLFCFEAYRRIGNDLREFVLYIADQDGFMAALNAQLSEHPRYPIDIKFYEDESWTDFQELISDLWPPSRPEVGV